MRGHGRRTPAPHFARGHRLGSSARVRRPGIVAPAAGAEGVRTLRLARRARPAEGDGVPQISPAIAAPGSAPAAASALPGAAAAARAVPGAPGWPPLKGTVGGWGTHRA